MYWRVRVFLTVAASSLAACSGGGGSAGGNDAGSSGSAPSSTQAKVTMSLVDAPFRSSGQTVTAVTITLKALELVGQSAPVVLQSFTPSLAINLLSFQTAPGIQLGTATIPAGQYQQARLILDTSSPNNNSVTLGDGTVHPLKIPSASGGNGGFGNTPIDNGDGPGQSGLKVNIGLDAAGGQTYSILLDFNAAESIVTAGNSGQWILKPVIVGSAFASGFFGGTVVLAQPTGSPIPVVNAQILAQQNGTTVNSGVTGMGGTYQINGLPQGTYTIVINNMWTSLAGAAQSATPSNGIASGTCAQTFTIASGQSTVNVTENSTPSPTPTPSATPSSSASPTATPTATATATATATPTPAPPFVCST